MMGKTRGRRIKQAQVKVTRPQYKGTAKGTVALPVLLFLSMGGHSGTGWGQAPGADLHRPVTVGLLPHV